MKFNICDTEHNNDLIEIEAENITSAVEQAETLIYEAVGSKPSFAIIDETFASAVTEDGAQFEIYQS